MVQHSTHAAQLPNATGAAYAGGSKSGSTPGPNQTNASSTHEHMPRVMPAAPLPEPALRGRAVREELHPHFQEEATTLASLMPPFHNVPIPNRCRSSPALWYASCRL